MLSFLIIQIMSFFTSARLGWSPDGHYVVSAHAMNNRGPVAKIVERDGWKCRMDFAGHRKAVTVVVSCDWQNINPFTKKIPLHLLTRTANTKKFAKLNQIVY